MEAPRHSFGNLRVRPFARIALAFVVVSNQLSVAALAAAPAGTLVLSRSLLTRQASAQLCTSTAIPTLPCDLSAGANSAQLSLPSGAQQCPSSGAAAACSDSTPAQPAPGVASIPDGRTACPSPPDKPVLPSPGACTDAVLPVPPAAPAQSKALPIVAPSVPISSLEVAGPSQRVDLKADATSVAAGQGAVLTATAGATVTGTATSIEIFDLTAGVLAGACNESSQCIVAYAAKSGVHTFAAFVTPATTTVPVNGPTIESNQVDVSWVGIDVKVTNAIVGPGKAVTLTATSTVPVEHSGDVLEFFDAATNLRLTYCSRGTTCSTSVTQAVGGTRSVIAAVARGSLTFPAPEIQSQSDPVKMTWLDASLAANTTYPQAGGTVYLTTNANTNPASTPWSLGIYDEQGHLVDKACKTGTTCVAQITLTNGVTPSFTAVIGTAPPPDVSGKLGSLLSKVAGPSSLVDVQARSDAVQPTRLLWGVDSCKAFTSDPNGGDGLYPQVVGAYGAPDFWGRYLTDTVCPAISATEIAAAAHHHMGILPIYNDYNCSNVVGYDTGKGYASAASAAAAALGIPVGRAIAIDIEPPGDACPGAANVDPGFVQGWFDGITAGRYVPAYYGNGTAGSEFASAWCGAVASQSEIANASFLWSFEPSLLGSYTKATAPDYAPHQTGCAGTMVAWQYELSAGSNPDVDTDEALSKLPLWFP